MPSVCLPMHQSSPLGATHDRQVCSGLEVPSSITWSGWEPGREYTKKIVVKNLQLKAQRLKYRTPSSKVFTTIYPRPVSLAAGNCFSLPITFHPLEKIPYEDIIEFTSSEGTFSVPIKAVVPDFRIEVTTEVDFGKCCVVLPACLKFYLKNQSELFTEYYIDCPEPFSIEAPHGTLQPFTTVAITATFTPAFATIYEARVLVKYGTECARVKETKFLGAGKLPAIRVSSACGKKNLDASQESVLEFGCVPVNSAAVRYLELKNVGEVPAEFTVEHPLVGHSQIESVYQCDPTSGCIPVGQTVRLNVTYTALMAGQRTIDYFYVHTVGSPTTSVIKCTGECTGPCLTFSKPRINFNRVDYGDCVTKSFDLINNSESEATFQFQIDCSESVFKFNVVGGVLPAKCTKTIQIQFQPQHPINYMRRVECIIHHQGILILELMGTCHTELGQPAVLKSIHVERYDRIERRGLSLYSPETLNSMLSSCELSLDEIDAAYQVNNYEGAKSDFHPMVDYINDGHHSEITSKTQHVSLDSCYLDFGQVNCCSPEVQMVSVTNHTNGKIFVSWTTDTSHAFSVSPSTAEISAEKSVAFRILFKPGESNMLYGAQLECYAVHKSSLSYQHTEDKTHFPPWCLILTATGHTFDDCSETFLPRLKFDKTKMSFSTVNPSDSDYRSLVLTNVGNTPVLFDVEKDPRRIFIQRPLRGIIPPGQLQIFIVQFSLQAEGAECQQISRINFNESHNNSQSILMIGSMEMADVSLDNNGVLYMKPTCVCMTTSRQYGVRNISKVPLEYKWHVVGADEANLRVEPSTGIIYPSERQFHTWYFTPTTDVKYMIKPVLSVWAEGNKDKKRIKKFHVRVVAEGTCGQIVCDRSRVELGCQVVGTGHSECLQLSNSANCELRYRLKVTQSVSGPYAHSDSSCDIELSTYEGILPGRSSSTVLTTVRPSTHLDYVWSIICQLLDSKGAPLTGVEDQTLCVLTAHGIHPSVRVVDIKGQGAATALSKRQLHNLFHLDTFNDLLENDPESSELIYKAPTRHSTEKRPEVYTRAVTEFNFCATPVGCDAFSVQIVLENPGPVACNWSFLLPCDQQIELDYWAETGEYTTEELQDLKVMENKLFTIEPKKGRLEPQKTCCVTLAYKHVMVGTDRLPVVFKLNRGREILINFVGVSVSVTRPYIHLTSAEHKFEPVPIGSVRSPVQVYEMHNGGAVPVQYTLDLTQLSDVCAENYSHPVFECFNPTGVVHPGCTALIEWRFSPLEAKTYTADVLIVIEDGESLNVRFIGVGIDERMLDESSPNSNNANQDQTVSKQRMLTPKQMCYLNTDLLSLGDLPLYTVTRKLVVLTNCSMLHGACYSWHVTSERDREIVRIYPSSGVLGPGENVVCKIMFTAIGQPAFYDMDLVCEIRNREQYEKYVKAYNAWKRECERQAVEFTITEKDLFADLRLADAQSEAADVEVNADMRAYNDEPNFNLKYKTLPPIVKQQTSEELREKLRARRRFEEEYWTRPAPPSTNILHLAITARTHDLHDFRARYPNCNTFLIDRTLQEACTMNPAELECYQLPALPCLQPEADMIKLVLTSVLRSLMDDDGFSSSCAAATMEPVPYYRQITEPGATHISEQLAEIDAEVYAAQMISHVEDTLYETINYSGKRQSYSVADEAKQSAAVAASVEEQLASAAEVGHAGCAGAEQLDLATSKLAAQGLQPSSTTGRQQATAAGKEAGNRDQLRESAAADNKEQQLKGSAAVNGDHQQSCATSDRTPTGSESGFTGGQRDRCPSEVLHEKCGADEADAEHQFMQRIKKHPVYASTVESLLENTVINILQEALTGEFNIAARPRLVALPPRQATPRNQQPFQKC